MLHTFWRSPEQQRLFRRRGMVVRNAPFVVVVSLLLVAGWFTEGADRHLLFATYVLDAVGVVLVLLIPWERLPEVVDVIPPVAGIALLGAAAYATGSLHSPLHDIVAIPVLYVALYGQLYQVVLMLATLLVEEVVVNVVLAPGGAWILADEAILARVVVIGAFSLVTAAALGRLRATNRRLEQLNQLMDFHLHALAHDLKNSLQGVLGFARLVEVSAAGGNIETTTRLAARIHSSTVRMRSLVDDILDLSAARRALEREWFAPVDVIREAMQGIAGIHVEFGEFPDRIYAHRPSIYRAFRNLFENAGKYARGDRDRPAMVVVYAIREHGYWCFHVEDDGPGIDEFDRERLFGVFERGTDVSHIEGTGLGLAVVAACAAAHGGDVSVLNRPAGGADFEIRIPVTLDERGQAGQSDVSSAGGWIPASRA